MQMVSFNSTNAKQFSKDYNKAVRAKAESFLFDGNEYVTNYAYYVIQYLMNNKIIVGMFDENKLFWLSAKDVSDN